jgi:hypothetical protein
MAALEQAFDGDPKMQAAVLRVVDEQAARAYVRKPHMTVANAVGDRRVDCIIAARRRSAAARCASLPPPRPPW